eukprot:778947-Amorphochlora_amoeboformis.AAC.3
MDHSGVDLDASGSGSGALCPLLTLPVEVAVFERNPLLVTRHTGQLSGQWIGISAMVFKTLINVYYQTRMRYLMVRSRAPSIENH